MFPHLSGLGEGMKGDSEHSEEEVADRLWTSLLLSTVKSASPDPCHLQEPELEWIIPIYTEYIDGIEY